jgi:hypothetical protein
MLSCAREVFTKCPTDVDSVSTNKEVIIDRVNNFI